MRTFNVIDENDKKIGEVKAHSYSDAFFEVDKKFGEKAAVDCRLEQRREPGQLETIVNCPICGETELEDISPRESNGIIGSGFASWKIVDLRCCPNCRIIIHPKGS